MVCQKDTYYFSSAVINLKNNSAIAKDTKIEMHKDIFGVIKMILGYMEYHHRLKIV